MMIYRIRGWELMVEITRWLNDNDIAHEALEMLPSPTTFEPLPVVIQLNDDENATAFALKWSRPSIVRLQNLTVTTPHEAKYHLEI